MINTTETKESYIGPRSNVVVFPQDVRDLLEVLAQSNHPRATTLLEILDLNSRSSERGEAYREAMEMDEDGVDQDDSPAVSHADDNSGTYVQVWKWVPRSAMLQKLFERHPELPIQNCRECGDACVLLPGEGLVHLFDGQVQETDCNCQEVETPPTETNPTMKPTSQQRLKRALWLAFVASRPVGMGFLHVEHAAAQTEDSLFDLYGNDKGFTVDYACGRMMKTAFSIKDGAVIISPGVPEYNYQSWGSTYATACDLLAAVDQSLAQ